ncbi:hypothetical protein EO238_31210, partial [Citrobacter sp. AAK_AS5]
MYEAIIAHSRAPVDVMMMPRANVSVIGRMAAQGLSGLAVNLEVFDRAIARSYVAAKAQRGRDCYSDFWDTAVATL